MNNAVILHGMPSREEYFDPYNPSESNKHWLPWTQKQLVIHDILAQTPELPTPYEPEYEKWLDVFKRFHIDEHTILIGHSCGAGFLVRWLSENNIKVGTVILVAPFLDPDGDEVKSDFFDFQISKKLSKNTKNLCIFYSTDDNQEILTSVEQILVSDDKIESRKFTDKGHFTYDDMKTEKFPELLKYIFNK